MKCADPILVYNTSKGSRQFRHFSLANDLFKKMHQQVFNCGKCLHCRKRRAYELACRCVLHASLYRDNCFVTLTYDEKRRGYHNNFQYKDIQDFKKRLRQLVWRKHAKRIEIFNVHEYGKKGKKHWHLVIFNYDFEDKQQYTTRGGIPYYSSKQLGKLWKFGFNNVGDVTEASAMYQAQYMEKDFRYDYVTSSRKSHSKHSGIGRDYFLANFKQILTLGYIPINGRKLPIPRYFLRIGQKHYSHFYDRSAFIDTRFRAALFSSFGTDTDASLEMADLWLAYKNRKAEEILDLAEEWEAVMLQHLTTKKSPDFITSAENTLYDLRNKPHTGVF